MANNRHQADRATARGLSRTSLQRRPFKGSWLYALAAPIGLSLGFCAASPMTALAQQNVVLVLDSSGSMAGRIGGVRKIDIARKAVGDILGVMDPKTKLGLFAYGHRRKGDCSDIQMIHDVAAPDRGSMMRAVNALKPLGKTPLSDAVLKAAETLRYTEEKATVILVSDGEETCDADPCALGQKLKEQGLDFKVHVVGFNIRRGEETGLQCLAQNTGGIYVAANNASALNKALAETVKKVEAETAKPRTEAIAAPGLKVRAFASAGGAELTENMYIQILGEPEGLDGKRKQIAVSHNVRSGFVFKNLKPGKYVMNIGLWNRPHTVRTTPIAYDGGAQTLDYSLDIGQVRFDATYKEGGPLIDRNMAWAVQEPTVNFDGKSKTVAALNNFNTKQVHWLPAGKWKVDARVWNAQHIRTTFSIEVKPGGQHAVPVNLNAGQVRFDTKLSEGSDLIKANLAWRVFANQTSFDGKRELVATFNNVNTQSVFLLPAGEWNVEGAIWNHNHVKFKTMLKVPAGGEVPHPVNINAGVVRFDTTVNGANGNEPLRFDILSADEDLSGKRAIIARFNNVRSGLITYLPAGKYLLRAGHWTQRGLSAEQQIDIVAGKEHPIKVDLAAK